MKKVINIKIISLIGSGNEHRPKIDLTILQYSALEFRKKANPHEGTYQNSMFPKEL